MKRTHILGGVLAAAVLAGGGAALGVAWPGPTQRPPPAYGAPAAGPSTATAPGSGSPQIGSAPPP